MKEIIRIIIKGGSGFGPAEGAYSDKIAICMDSIRYEYKPMMESAAHAARKWFYRTTSPAFRKLFEEASEAVQAILDREEIPSCTDLGVTTFAVTYADRTRAGRDFILPGDEFRDCFAIVKRMVPACEDIPAVLMTSEDHEDQLEDDD